MSQLIQGRKNGYEVVTGGYRLKYLPAVDGAVQGVGVFTLPRNTFVTQIIGVNNTDDTVSIKLGDDFYNFPPGDKIRVVGKSFVTKAGVYIGSDATEGECTIIVQTLEYDRVQGTRAIMGTNPPVADDASDDSEGDV